MKIQIMLEAGMPKSAPQPHDNKKSVEQQVKEAIDLVDTGYCSHVEWLLLNKLYKSLAARPKPTPRIKNLINMIEPVLAKYGFHGVSDED